VHRPRNYAGNMAEISFTDHIEGRYDRHNLITWWDQRTVANARVIVAGAGALGNEVLKLLALVGVGHILVMDFDTVSRSNLARMVLFREEDIGKPKVLVAADRVREINPDVEIRPIEGDLRFAIGLGEYRSADLVLGCLDSINARWALNRKCMQAGVEWIDGGITDFHGSVARYSPAADACYECNFTARTIERFNRRYSCPFGLISGRDDDKMPTTAVTTSVIAAFQIQQALMMLHGIDEGLQPGERLSVYLKPYRMIQDKLPLNPDCLAHFTLPSEIPVAEYAEGLTVGQVIRAARAIYPGVDALSLPFEIVVEFQCETCDTHQPVLRPKEKVLHAEAICPVCGDLRTPVAVDTINVDSALAGLSFGQLEIPPREILTFAAYDNEDRLYLQFGS